MSKRMTEIGKNVDKKKQYSLGEAADILKNSAKVKFDETIELHIKLGIDPKQSNQIVRGTVVLPHGLGKSKKIAVIAKGEKLREAEQGGADFFGDADLIEKISKGWFDFDVLIATPDAMKDLARLGKTLGPKGLMPNPKSGTVTFDIKKTINELKAGRVEFKNDASGTIHCSAGKVSFPKEKIVENLQSLLDAIVRSKPPSSKGQFLRNIVVSSTMGPGIHVSFGSEAD